MPQLKDFYNSENKEFFLADWLDTRLMTIKEAIKGVESELPTRQERVFTAVLQGLCANPGTYSSFAWATVEDNIVKLAHRITIAAIEHLDELT